jgi:hypothetical protein
VDADEAAEKAKNAGALQKLRDLAHEFALEADVLAQRYPTAGQLDLTEANLNVTRTEPIARETKPDYTVFESKPVTADPSKPQGARPPVPGPGEDQSGIYASHYNHLSERNHGLAPELQLTIAEAVFQ